jgi:mannan endo-1,4-beta-mannosidase
MIKCKISPFHFLIICGLSIFFSCKTEDEDITLNDSAQKYSVTGSKILTKTKPVQLIGANSFRTFSAGSADMNSWNIDIAREFIGNAMETPLTGTPIRDSNGAYLHSLQSVVDGNRINNRITILCGFGWDGTSATEYTGKSPSQTYWWHAYKLKLQQWAIHFKNQQDVWIEVWNEPYRYDRADGYTDDIWEKDMNELVAHIRNTGNSNIILVPCAEQGQDESVLLNQGKLFLTNKENIIFDIHAYEKWLLDTDVSIINRLDKLKRQNLPIFIGEVAPLNAGILMNPQSFLDIISNRGISVCGWVWKKDENDKNALLTKGGLTNNNNNNNWGTTFKNLSLKSRNP